MKTRRQEADAGGRKNALALGCPEEGLDLQTLWTAVGLPPALVWRTQREQHTDPGQADMQMTRRAAGQISACYF